MGADDVLSAAVPLERGKLRKIGCREQAGIAEPPVRAFRRDDPFGVRRARFEDPEHAFFPEERLVTDEKKHGAARLCCLKTQPDGEGNALLRRAVAHGEKAAPLALGENILTAGHDRDAREKLLWQNVHRALEKTFAAKFREQLSAAEARARSRGQQDARDGAHIHFVIHFRPLFRHDAALCGIQTVEVLCKKRRQIAIVVKMVLPNVYSAQNQDAIFGEY